MLEAVADGGRRRHRDRHPVLRPDDRRPDHPGGVAAPPSARGTTPDAILADLVADRRRRAPGRDDLLQPRGSGPATGGSPGRRRRPAWPGPSSPTCRWRSWARGPRRPTPPAWPPSCWWRRRPPTTGWRPSAERSRGFVYAVGLMGVTGERTALAASARRGGGAGQGRHRPAGVRRCRDLHAGPGGRGPCEVADGVVVGSALVRRLLDGGGPAGRPSWWGSSGGRSTGGEGGIRRSCGWSDATAMLGMVGFGMPRTFLPPGLPLRRRSPQPATLAVGSTSSHHSPSEFIANPAREPSNQASQ